MFRIAEKQRCSAVDQEFLYLIPMERGVERNRRPAGGDDPQICRHPSRMIPARIATLASRGTRVESHFATLSAMMRKFRKSHPLDNLRTLNLKSNIVRELSGRLQKALVEGGHRSEVNILKVEQAKTRIWPTFISPAPISKAVKLSRMEAPCLWVDSWHFQQAFQ